MRKRFAISLTIVVLALAGIYFLYTEQQYNSQLTTPLNATSTERISIRVEKGASAKEISALLQTKKVIGQGWVFNRYVREKNIAGQLRSGTFVLQPSQTIPEIAEILTGQKVQELSLTIPEGYTVKQINELLKTKQLVRGNEFLDCVEKCSFPFDFLGKQEITSLEGFLFPSTYFIDPITFTPASFLNRLLGTFEKKIAPYRQDIPAGKLYDTVIMASLIEREASTDAERPVVAGILWKRLENHWYLGVDATIRYYKDDWVNEITYADLQDRNPYNTRTHLGLPPTPIANPGLASLKAAIYPTATEYWYYLHDGEGKIHYAKTLAEHTQNRIKYLE